MGLFSRKVTDEEVREIVVEYPSGNQWQIGTNKANANKVYADQEAEGYIVVSDSPSTSKEPGLLGRLFGK
jgi:hypothetical protein